MITIEQEDGDVWLVTVCAATKTQHRVTVSAANLERFGRGKMGARALLEASFRFLLEREPNTSILPAFDLPIIARYFPEYERELGRYLTN